MLCEKDEWSMRKLTIGLILGVLLISPTISQGISDASSMYTKGKIITGKNIYNDVKITSITDVTGWAGKIFPPDVAMRCKHPHSYHFQTRSGGKYVVEAIGNIRDNKVGFYLKRENGDKRMIYLNALRFAQWFRVYRITTSELGIELWGILSDRGAATSSIISGFYIFMDKDGVLQPILTDVEMDAFGMAFDSQEKDPPGHAFAHMLKREIVNGSLRMEYAYQYWYGNMAHSQARYVVDNVGYLVWDNTAQTFKLVHGD